MSIQAYVKELEALDIELKKVKKRTTDLKKRKSYLESQIAEFLESKNQPGVKFESLYEQTKDGKFKTKAVTIESKSKRIAKKLRERDHDAIEVLRKHGIHHAKEVFRELMEARKGEQVDTKVLKTHELKDKKY